MGSKDSCVCGYSRVPDIYYVMEVNRNTIMYIMSGSWTRDGQLTPRSIRRFVRTLPRGNEIADYAYASAEEVTPEIEKVATDLWTRVGKMLGPEVELLQWDQINIWFKAEFYYMLLYIHMHNIYIRPINIAPVKAPVKAHVKKVAHRVVDRVPVNVIERYLQTKMSMFIDALYMVVSKATGYKRQLTTLKAIINMYGCDIDVTPVDTHIPLQYPPYVPAQVRDHMQDVARRFRAVLPANPYEPHDNMLDQVKGMTYDDRVEVARKAIGRVAKTLDLTNASAYGVIGGVKAAPTDKKGLAILLSRNDKHIVRCLAIIDT